MSYISLFLKISELSKVLFLYVVILIQALRKQRIFQINNIQYSSICKKLLLNYMYTENRNFISFPKTQEHRRIRYVRLRVKKKLFIWLAVNLKQKRIENGKYILN